MTRARPGSRPDLDDAAPGDPAATDPTDPTAADPTASDPTATDPTAADPAAADPTGPGPATTAGPAVGADPAADPAPSAPSDPARGSVLARVLPLVAAVGGIVAAWYAVSYLVMSPAQRFLLPPPHAVFGHTLTNPRLMDPMLEALGRTVVVALVGLVLAVVLGIGWAVAMSQSGVAEKVLYPYAVILQTIPILALIPLIGIWLGYGVPARILVCVIIALFPMISNTFFGLGSASAAAHDLFTLNRATRAQRLLKLQFPAAVPSIFTGLRNAAGLSVIGAIVGDFYFQQGAPGIGGLLRVYTLRIQMEALLTAVTLTALFGVAVFALFAAADRAVVGRWYGYGGRR